MVEDGAHRGLRRPLRPRPARVRWDRSKNVAAARDCRWIAALGRGMPMTWSKLRLLFAFGLAAALGAIPARAAVFNVDTTVDDPALTACDDATPNDCSLRGAIIRANGLTEAVTINVPAGTYILSQATPCFFGGNSLGALFTTPALCPVRTLTLAGRARTRR